MMKRILKQEKKKLLLSLLLAVALVAVDELIKTAIFYFDKKTIGNCTGSDSLIHYHPVFNEAGSFLNIKFDVEYSYFVFLGINIVGLLLSVYMFCFLLQSRYLFRCSGIVYVPAAFFFAACLGRLIERIVWGYTLDYVAIKKIGIIDLIDMYLWVAGIGFVIAIIHIQMLEKKVQVKRVEVS